MDLLVDLSRPGPLRPQLERALREGIRSGRLVAGSKLPPSRTLAGDLGISRGVVMEAYAQLIAEGYLTARQGDGTRVASGAPAVPVTARSRWPADELLRYDLNTGTPDLSAFPRRDWAAALTAALHDLPDAQLGYYTVVGLPVLRDELAAYLGRVRAVAVDPANVVVTCGCVHSMSLLWQTLARQGARRVAVEDPCWAFVQSTVRAAGLEPVGIPVDEQGLMVDQLEHADVSAVALSPAHQYPIGSTLAPERRGALIAWARRTGALIVEDDYDAEFRYDREPVGSIQGLAPDCVAYLGSTSKTIAPGLSIGWMALPPALAGEIVVTVGGTRALPGTLVQAAYATLLESGAVDRHLRRMRRVYRQRRDALVAALGSALPEGVTSGTAAGLHLLLWLPAGVEERAAAAACVAAGVGVDGLRERCVTARDLPPALILGYGQIEAPVIGAAIQTLATAVSGTAAANVPRR